jgi:hypothetical protein
MRNVAELERSQRRSWRKPEATIADAGSAIRDAYVALV